jgi:DNA-binding NtrC family response regulator
MRIHSISRNEPVGDPRRFDVCLLDLSVERPHALGIAGEVCANDPTLECLFVTNDLASPGAAAARSLGIRKIVTADQSISWWSSTLQALAELTNARRALREAEQRVPPIPPSQSAGHSQPVPLPEAERQFRRAYLSRLIHEDKSHKRAASRAGVPYTTLCSMLKKLGLE